MRVTQLTLIITYMISTGQCRMEPFIVNGYDAHISEFPYSANLYIRCRKKDGNMSGHICGSSIINQYLTLTAAHCTSKCDENIAITVYVGHEVWRLGASSTADSYRQHEDFHREHLTNDIALVRLKTPLKFGSNVMRIALMENPPYREEAFVAGWGRYSLKHHYASKTLQYAIQYLVKKGDCPKRNKNGDVGTFCATSIEGHAAKGDSGSALIVHNYIQIGIVSNAVKTPTNRWVFFTDTAYYYKWIQKNSKVMLCYDGGPGDSSICSLSNGEKCQEVEKK